MPDAVAEQAQKIDAEGRVTYDLFSAPLTLSGTVDPQLAIFDPSVAAGEIASIRFHTGGGSTTELGLQAGVDGLFLEGGFRTRGAGAGLYLEDRSGNGPTFGLEPDAGFLWFTHSAVGDGLRYRAFGANSGGFEIDDSLSPSARIQLDPMGGYGAAHLASNVFFAAGAHDNDDDRIGSAMARAYVDPFGDLSGIFDVYTRIGADDKGAGSLRFRVSHFVVGVNHAGSSAYWLDVNGPAHASSFPVSSDARLKRGVRELAAEAVMSGLRGLRAVAFEWDADAGRRAGRDYSKEPGVHIGLIAQDVELAFPELVSRWRGVDAVEYMAVDYGRVVALLVAGVKELDRRVALLEAA